MLYHTQVLHGDGSGSLHPGISHDHGTRGSPDAGAEVDEFWAVGDIIDIFGEQLSGFLTLGEKPPNNYQFAVQGICDAIKDMPHCIFDVMRGRCIFSITHDTMEENGELWRYGIKSSRLIEKINEISANIREERDYGYQ